MAESNAVQSKGYLVKVRGEYFAAAAGNRKILSIYELEVKLPSMDKALSVIKNKLLDKLLKLKYSDYINYRTHELVSFKALGITEDLEHLPLHLQGREQLIKYIKKAKLPIDENIYIELGGLRKAVALCEADPKKYAETAIADRAEYEEDRKLQDLNPEIDPGVSVSEEPSEKNASAKARDLNQNTEKLNPDPNDETGLDL